MVELYIQRFIRKNDLSNPISDQQLKFHGNINITNWGLRSEVGEIEELNSSGLRRHV
jgi:hypothetical protein